MVTWLSNVLININKNLVSVETITMHYVGLYFNRGVKANNILNKFFAVDAETVRSLGGRTE